MVAIFRDDDFEKALADDAIDQVDGDPALAGQVRAIKKAFGKNVVFFRRNTNDIFGFEGVIINGNTIYINESLQNPFTATVFHELLHQLRINRPDLYRQLASAAITSTLSYPVASKQMALREETASMSVPEIFNLFTMTTSAPAQRSAICKGVDRS